MPPIDSKQSYSRPKASKPLCLVGLAEHLAGSFLSYPASLRCTSIHIQPRTEPSLGWPSPPTGQEPRTRVTQCKQRPKNAALLTSVLVLGAARCPNFLSLRHVKFHHHIAVKMFSDRNYDLMNLAAAVRLVRD